MTRPWVGQDAQEDNYLSWVGHKTGGLRSVVSHPGDKNKDVARMGHPTFVVI